MSAASFFDVKHSSVEVELTDGKTTKTLNLSPVMLAHRSVFYATRYKPGSDWKRSVLEVENVDVAEHVLRACYNMRGMDTWDEKGVEWLFQALRTCNMLQVALKIVNKVLKLIRGLIVARRDLTEPDVLEFLHTVGELRDTTPVHKCTEFWVMLRFLFDTLIGFDKSPTGIGAACDKIPESLQIDCLWHVVGNKQGPKRTIALKMFVQNLLETKDDAEAKPYLRKILLKAFLNVSDKDRDIILVELAKIVGDELNGSTKLRARDALALRLKGGIDPAKKRKRGSEPSETDIEDFFDDM